MAILVDTGALELLRRRSRDVEALILRCYPPLLCLHIAAEFLYGQVAVNVTSSSLLQAQEFIESFEILTPSLATASIYARVRNELKASGCTLPDPDYWIAAHAIEERLPLISTDKHFLKVPDIRLHLIPLP